LACSLNGLFLDGRYLKAGSLDLGQNGPGETFAGPASGLTMLKVRCATEFCSSGGNFVCSSILIAVEVKPACVHSPNLLECRHVALAVYHIGFNSLLPALPAFAMPDWWLQTALCQSAPTGASPCGKQNCASSIPP